MYTRWSNQVAKFQSDERGTVAILFGLTVTATLFLSGVALDYARVTDAKQRMSQAIDAASLAAGRALLDGKLDDREIETLAQTFIAEDLKALKTGAKVGKPAIKIDRQNGGITIDISAEVGMTLTSIAGFKSLNVPVTSVAVYQQRDIEVGMALDITGSMGEVPSKGGKRKIDALKSAFEMFADRLLPTQTNTPQKVRIALAPYSTAVNLGNFARIATNDRSTDNCVTERKNGLATDASGFASPFLVAQDGVKDVDPTEGIPKAPSYACPATLISTLSDDRDSLVNSVKQFKPEGWTAGHLGIQWAWNLISDQWGGTWGGDSVPDSYSRVSEGKLLKAVILMTDGVFNTSYHGDKSAAQAIALCNAMKAKGVVVFAVAFDAPAEAQQTLKSCSSGGNEYYADAGNGAELEDAFSKFAGKLSDLRISQ